MATPGVILGHNLRVRFGTSTATKIFAQTECSISIETDTTEINHKDNYSAGWKEILPSVSSWNASSNGIIYFDATTGVDDIIAAQTAKTKVKFEFTTDASGDYKLSGDAYITSCELSGSVGENSTYAVSFLGTGALTPGTNS